MLEHLKKLNPGINFYSVDDPEFRSFGRVIEGLDIKEICAAASAIPNPESGSSYVATEPTFEALPIAKQIADGLFGAMPTETGFCWGHNSKLQATEWHTSSEINIAVTPFVLILGHRYDIKENHIDSSDFTAFYVPAGKVLEVYSTSLHFCPCEVEPEGFRCVVALPQGTNTPLEETPDDKLLFRKNKWLLSHMENEGLIARGAVPGITGENYQIHY